MKHGGKRKGSGRKKLNVEAFTCLLPVELLREIKQQANFRGIPISKIIRERLGA